MKHNEAITNIDNIILIIKKYISEHLSLSVFYSWQSDTDAKYNRNLIEDCIKKSIKKFNSVSGDIKYSFDKDTRGISGSPDITNTILQKIDSSSCFIADVTPTSNSNKYVCNSNVMLELGYALSSLSSKRVLLICNTAICSLKELPFDINSKRIIEYKATESDSREVIKENKENLISVLFDALSSIDKL